MSDFLPGGLGWLAGSCLCVLLWGLSVGAASWDLHRRALSQTEARAWLALVGLVPVLGFVAYLFSRLLGALFPLVDAGPQPGSARRRITRLKLRPAPVPRTGTIAAADLVSATIASLPAAPRARVALEVVAGPHAGSRLVADSLPACLGRGGEAALRLDQDRGVSRLHAEVYSRDGVLRIRDLGSTHGTAVNGQTMHDQALNPGDMIEIGRSALIVKVAES